MANFAYSHPAKFTQVLYDEMRALLAGRSIQSILDPFAGVGGIHNLRDRWYRTVGVELEPEWARQSPYTLVGNAAHLPFADGVFDAVVTSPAYGNRMADRYAGDARGTRRYTYRVALGRDLSPGSGAALQWGRAYRALHMRVWEECHRVIRPAGYLLLNMKDHVRAGQVVRVTDWHTTALISLGFGVRIHKRVPTPGQRHGENGNLRADCESLILFQKEST